MKKSNEILAQFKESVLKHPNRIALVDKNRSLSFSELDQLLLEYAKNLKFIIATNFIKSYIPIVVTRDVESASLILACLIHEIPFTPIDVDWEKGRLGFVAEAIGHPSIWITSSENVSHLQSKLPDDVTVISLESNGLSNLAVVDKANPMERLDGGYVIFTSGTTGVPKGVVYNQNGINGKYKNRRESLGESSVLPEDSFQGLLYPLHFSAGLWSLSNVASGVSLKIYAISEMEVVNFINAVRSDGVNKLSLPPSILYLLAASKTKSNSGNPLFQEVREVSFGGDAVPYSVLAKLSSFFNPETTFRTGYGASEVSAWLYYTFIFREMPKSGQIPLAILSEAKNIHLVPHEEDPNYFVLGISGPQAVGYLNEPELTNERFLQDKSGMSWWYSGDLVEVDEAGLIWHRGRVDDLVKIRGKLTSPSEATRALNSIPGVADAVVFPISNGQQVRLVAHISLDSESKISAKEIRANLSETLPAHLIPSKIMRHQTLPKNSRGKPDRKKLLEIEFVNFRDESVRTPITFFEERVKLAAEEVLGIESLSTDDDLSLYGLDSLAALELHENLKNEFPNVDFDSISSHPKIEQIAKTLETQATDSTTDLYIFNINGSKDPIHAFPGGEGMRYSQFAQLADALGEDQPVYVHRHLLDDVSLQNTTISGQAEKILNSITHDLKSTPVKILGYSGGGAQAYEMARLCSERGIAVDLTLLDTSTKSINLTTRYNTARFAKAITHKFGNPSVKLLDLLKLLFEGFRRQGLIRSTRVIFLERLPAVLLAIPLVRNLVRSVVLAFPNSLSRRFARGVVPALVLHSRADYIPQPISAGAQLKLSSRLFYVGTNNDWNSWANLIPNITFMRTSGDHTSMIRTPYVSEIADSLSQSWNVSNQTTKKEKSL